MGLYEQMPRQRGQPGDMSLVVNEARVLVVQRQTVDWQSISLEAFREQSRGFCRLWSKPEDYVWRLRELWDETFGMTYLQTRALLKAQSEQQMQAVPGIQFVPYQQYTNIPSCNLPYLFVDDDDWVSPAIAVELVPQLPPQYTAVLWRAVNIGSPQQESPMFVWGMNGRCMTNNYALSGAWLRETGRLSEFIQHFDAMKAMATLPPISQLDLTVTATNKSPCSSVSLDRGLGGNLQPARLVAMVEVFLEKMLAVREEHVWQAPWVLPLIRELAQVFQAVMDSRR